MAAGNTVYVSGCTSVEGRAYEQTARALETIRAALAALGLPLTAVVRTRLYVTRIEDWQEVGRAHREAFPEAPPASSLVQVAALIDPRMLIEVEAVAWSGVPPEHSAFANLPSANLPSANLLLGRRGITARVSRRRLGLSGARPMCQAGPLGQERRIDLGDRFRAAVPAPRGPSRQPPRPMRSPRPAR